MFDGVGSPITQTFGLGLFDPIGPAEMEKIESFFSGFGAEPLHEISPLADPALWPLLAERGYRPIEFTTILVRPTSIALPDGESPVTTRLIESGEEGLWARISAEGWGATEEVAAFVRDLGDVVACGAGSLCFLAELEGVPVGAAAMGLSEGVAHLAAARARSPRPATGGRKRPRFAPDSAPRAIAGATSRRWGRSRAAPRRRTRSGRDSGSPIRAPSGASVDSADDIAIRRVGRGEPAI